MTVQNLDTSCETCDGRGVLTDNKDQDHDCPKCDGTGQLGPVKISEPGVYDLPVNEYHADPVEGGSLSSTGARLMLPPNAPAIFKYRRDHPLIKKDFDFGHAAHQLVLGAGPQIVVVEDEWGKDPNEWRTNNVKARVQEVRDSGAVPIKPNDYEVVQEMAAAIRDHPVASALISNGAPEQTLVWQDRRTGVWRRALLDWLPDGSASGRLIVSDYKTTNSANPDAIQKACYSYGYHQQADWYLDGVTSLELAEDPAFVFIFQEKTPPYLVTVAELDVVALRLAREKNREAIDLYQECVAADRWPGYSDEIELIPLPAWVENKYLRESM